MSFYVGTANSLPSISRNYYVFSSISRVPEGFPAAPSSRPKKLKIIPNNDPQRSLPLPGLPQILPPLPGGAPFLIKRIFSLFLAAVGGGGGILAAGRPGQRMTNVYAGRRWPKMAGVGVAVMIRRWFNDEVVAMATAGTGQGRSAGSGGGGGGRHHAISSAGLGCRYTFLRRERWAYGVCVYDGGRGRGRRRRPSRLYLFLTGRFHCL